VVLRQTYIGTDDPDAAAYIAVVESADTAAGESGGLETAVKVAIHSFVKGCKADGIWNAIKASCILAGARTLSGALVPLVGAAPTNNNFVSGDYNRETGLVGNGSTKYLNSNRANNADPQNNQHISAYVITLGASGGPGTANRFPSFLSADAGSSGSTGLLRSENNASSMISRSHCTTGTTTNFTGSSGLVAASRSVSASYDVRLFGANATITQASQTSSNSTFFVYTDNSGGIPSGAAYNPSRLAFYSIGESLNLELLDTRVTTLINAIAAAIP
jgi:hypothetical protein